ncbi:protein BFR2-like [Prosopis cineraria]|uniref:protein BFR2-like n=1 Tax=Prosopis cineraria TaxID=364024 RepID=UPI00240FC174|nr:protein BFR2-like [Prosopis cineraria]XP_054794277.1 protein BFR2-like [Prosopis cineraria]XP_054794278.1 protein BFR2-like [Prosopis cineraria]
MGMNGTVDVSCYLCFEATGDSEAPSDPIKDPNIACRIPICDDDYDDDDDAQSCCYDASESLSSDELFNDEVKKEDEHEDELEVCVHEATREEEDDDEDSEMQEQKKVSVRVDSGAEKVDEMEKNRLFWEACLAS